MRKRFNCSCALFLEKISFRDSVKVSLSGTPVTVTAVNCENAEFKYSVHLENKTELSEISVECNADRIILPIVNVLGISHVIADSAELNFDHEKVIKDICKKQMLKLS